MLEFFLFGGVRVVGPDKEEIALGRKQCQLMSILMLSAGSFVAPDVLIDFLWGEKLPANPSNSLQDLIKRLRLALGDTDRTTVVTKNGGYGLFVDPDLLDVAVFRRLAVAGLKVEKAEPGAARLLLQRAMEYARGDLPDISPEFRVSEEIDELNSLRSAVSQAFYRIDLAEEDDPGPSDAAFAIWSLGGTPVGLALRLAELGELALADLVVTVGRFGGRIHQLSRGLVLASFAEGGAALRTVKELFAGLHPNLALNGGAIRHFESTGRVNNVDRLLQMAESAPAGSVLVSDEVHRSASAAAARLGDHLVPLEGNNWLFQPEGDKKAPAGRHEPVPASNRTPLLFPAAKVVAGSPRLFWGRTLRIALGLEDILSGVRNLRPM